MPEKGVREHSFINSFTFSNFFLSSFAIMNLTTSEIKQSFYFNHSGVYGTIYHIYHGKTISIDYIGNVLNAYGEFKIRRIETHYELDRLLNPPPPKPIPVYTLDDYKKMIQEDYEKYQNGDTTYIYNIEKKYIILRRVNGKGIINYPSKVSWHKWYDLALKTREADAKAALPINEAERYRKKNTLSMYEAIRDTKVVPHEEFMSVIHTMRKLVYFRFFKLMQGEGIKDIFKEVNHTTFNKDVKLIFHPHPKK